MTNDLTIDTLAFKLSWSDADRGSFRSEISRGPSLPEVLTIRHSRTTDSAFKRLFDHTVVRADYHLALSDGTIVPSSMWMVRHSPVDTAVTDVIMLKPLLRLVKLLSDYPSTGLSLQSEIFANRLQ
jgi:hypothetical protein